MQLINNYLKQSLKQTIKNNGFYLKDKYINFQNIQQDRNEFQMSIPLFWFI